jgi:hypothetical protein
LQRSIGFPRFARGGCSPLNDKSLGVQGKVMDPAARDKKKAWKDEERRRDRAAFPLPDEQLAEFLDALAKELDKEECDNTRRFTEG